MPHGETADIWHSFFDPETLKRELGARLFTVHTGGPKPDLSDFFSWRDKLDG
ncbi:hypothetical protein [Actinoplanes hulinensis]|uniref:hypothetical protein n=1 Tax=Actinoplanes hulinensis TaxID=1144547 RepID=UPI001FE7400B|nr:hypothetical protein [Actinoplanes hulinensis]